MPAFSNITVDNRETVPDSVVFEPRKNELGVALFTNSSGVPVGEKTISISTRRNGPKQKVRFVMKDPVVANEVINGITLPKVVRTAYADLTFSFDTTSSTQERKNLVGMLENMLAEAQALVTSVVVDLEDVY